MAATIPRGSSDVGRGLTVGHVLKSFGVIDKQIPELGRGLSSWKVELADFVKRHADKIQRLYELGSAFEDGPDVLNIARLSQGTKDAFVRWYAKRCGLPKSPPARGKLRVVAKQKGVAPSALVESLMPRAMYLAEASSRKSQTVRLGGSYFNLITADFFVPYFCFIHFLASSNINSPCSPDGATTKSTGNEYNNNAGKQNNTSR